MFFLYLLLFYCNKTSLEVRENVACVAGVSGEGSGKGKTERGGGGALFSSPLPPRFMPATQARENVGIKPFIYISPSYPIKSLKDGFL